MSQIINATRALMVGPPKPGLGVTPFLHAAPVASTT